MLTTSATNLRNNLFHYLEKVIHGETIIVYRNKKEVARLIPPNLKDWRSQLKTKIKLCVPPDEIIEPIEDVWKDYV